MNLLQTIRDKLRREPMTAEQLAARTEAKLLKEQMQEDRASQKSRTGQVYRSRGR